MAKKITMNDYMTVLANAESMATHVATVSYGWISLYANQLSQHMRKNGMLEDKKMCSLVDAVCKSAHKMDKIIYGHTSKKMEQATAPWLCYGQDEYFAEGRLAALTQQLINEHCKQEIDALVAMIDKTVYGYSDAKDKEVMRWAVLLNNWATFYRLGASKCMKEFKEAVCGHQNIPAPPLVTLHYNLAKGTELNIKAMISYLGGNEDEVEEGVIKSYHNAQNVMAQKIVKSKYDREFRLRGVEVSLHDWLDYWVGRVTRDTLANEGRLPEQVEQEITNLEALGKMPIRANLLRLISKLSKEVGDTDDVWDYADYLHGHQWKVTDDIYSICYSEVSKNITQ